MKKAILLATIALALVSCGKSAEVYSVCSITPAAGGLDDAAINSTQTLTAYPGGRFSKATVWVDYTRSAASAVVVTPHCTLPWDSATNATVMSTAFSSGLGTMSAATLSNAVSGSEVYPIELGLPTGCKTLVLEFDGTGADGSDLVDVGVCFSSGF